MAQTTGAVSTYDEPTTTGGAREDLGDIIFDLSPTETPGITMIGKGKAKHTNHEWLTDVLANPADNAHIEGDDANPAAPASRTRLGNYTQILKKHSVVTGTHQDGIKLAGVKKEMAYQVARRMREIKRDLERAIFGLSQAKVAGNDTTARKMGSLDSFMTSSDLALASSSTNPTGNGTDVSDYGGTDRAITEAIFTKALSDLWEKSGGNTNIMAMCGAFNRAKIATFTGSNTRYASIDKRRLTASIDVYDGDFHTVTVLPNRYSNKNQIQLLDKEYLKLVSLRNIRSYDLAKVGDSYRKEIVWEVTLEVCNSKAQMLIGDLTSA